VLIIGGRVKLILTNPCSPSCQAKSEILELIGKIMKSIIITQWVRGKLPQFPSNLQPNQPVSSKRRVGRATSVTTISL